MTIIFKKIVGFLFAPIWKFFDKPYVTKYIEDPIDNPQRKTLYIVGSAKEPWQAEILCPCGCKEKIVLPVNDSTDPRWVLNLDANMPTLSPSIWRSKGCKSHFFLRQGRIVWC